MGERVGQNRVEPGYEAVRPIGILGSEYTTETKPSGRIFIPL